MKQTVDNKTTDMFDSAPKARVNCQAERTVEQRIADAVKGHVRYVNSFSQTGTWSARSGQGYEYWHETTKQFIYEGEMKKRVANHLKYTTNKISKITQGTK